MLYKSEGWYQVKKNFINKLFIFVFFICGPAGRGKSTRLLNTTNSGEGSPFYYILYIFNNEGARFSDDIKEEVARGR